MVKFELYNFLEIHNLALLTSNILKLQSKVFLQK